MTPPAGPAGDRYRHVREQLERRGYLGGSIQRFVLRELLVEHARPVRLVRTASKAALVGGPLLGALLALAAAGAHRAQFGPVDVAWLWLWFSLVSAVALFALAGAVAWLVGAWVRRRGGGARGADALRGGLMVALPTLLYLLALWWRRGPEADWLVDLVFLLGANLTALLVAWLAGLVSMVSAVGQSGAVPDRYRRPIAVALLVLAPLSAGWLVARAFADRADPHAPAEFAVAPTGGPLLLVGIDGLDAEALAATAARDENLGRFYRGAGRFPLARPAGAEPAEVWTTIATGMPPAVHGIRGAGAELLPGVAAPLSPGAGPLPLAGALELLLPTRTVAVSGRGRAVRTLWEIVALERPSLSIGWWASWPADQDAAGRSRAFVLSDRVLPKLLAGGAPNRETAPGTLLPRIAEAFPADREALRAGFEALFSDLGLGPEVERIVWESFQIDAFRWLQLERLGGIPELRAAFVYLPGLDILRHRLDEAGKDAPGVASRYRDWLAGRIVSARGLPLRPARILVVADSGRGAPGRDGLVLLPREGEEPAPEGCDGPRLQPEDVAPLALALAGYPASREMPGRLPEAGCAGPLPAAGDRVAGFGRRLLERSVGTGPDDEEMVERLRSLGYLR